jgi:DNA polymerase III subunit epsilon
MHALNARLRFILAVVILLLLMTGPFILASSMIWLDAQENERALLKQLIVPHLPLGTLLTAFGFVCGVTVIRYLFREYVGGLLRMAEHLRLLLDANRHFKIKTDGPPEVRELADAANSLALQRNQLIDSVQTQINEANGRVEEEKNRLAALISELAQAVVVCNRDGKVLLYNQQARLLFLAMSEMASKIKQNPSAGSIGLGRSIYTLLDRQQIDHALEIVKHRLSINGQGSQASFVLTTPQGQLLRVQMAPVLSNDKVENETSLLTGYVLSIENITRNFEHESHRDQAFSHLVGDIRAHLIPVRTALQNLQSSELPSNISCSLMRIESEVAAVNSCLDAGMVDFARMLKFRWPLDEMLVSDVIAAARRRIEHRLNLATQVDIAESESLWVRADSFNLVFALQFLASNLQTACDIRLVTFRQHSDYDHVFLDVVWQAQMVSSETVSMWELDAMTIGGESSPLNLREVLQRHGGEIRYGRDKTKQEAYLRIILPKIIPESVPSRHTINRPEYYDFDLFHARENIDLLDRPLKEIAYTVFDTETTGLEPSKGDEIIQFGAVRVLNNRILAQESFDQLVDPLFPLPLAGVEIHGIHNHMVRGQPTIDVVLPAFHAFAADTVLVAHNAAFDMKFLQIKEASTGISFGQPVLDTLLLSAVVHPNQSTHSLDAIAERLGVPVTARHNALGDALVTAVVFQKLVPLLLDKGIKTLRQALEASEKTYFARVTY